MSRPEYHAMASNQDAQLPTLAAPSPLDVASSSNTVRGTVPQSVLDALADAETLRTVLGVQAAQAVFRYLYHDWLVSGGYERAEEWLRALPEFARLRCPCGECVRAGRVACAWCAAGDMGIYSPPEMAGSWAHRTLMQGTVLCARAAFRAVPGLREAK